MKVSAVIGRKIVSVNQKRETSFWGGSVWDVTSFTLDNGTVLAFVPRATDESLIELATEVKVHPNWAPKVVRP